MNTRHLFRRVLPTLTKLVGRRQAVRFARLLLNELRLDVPNDLTTNGEALVQGVVVRNAPRGAIILDVGANKGEWAASLLASMRSEHRADLRLDAFEPCQATFEILKSVLAHSAGNLSARAVQAGFSDRKGTATLHVVSAGCGINSLYPQSDHPAVSLEEVALMTLDEYVQRAPDEVVFVKIDVEGHDLAVLRGACGLIDRHAVGVFQFEYNHRWIVPRHVLLDAFELLIPRGYSLGKVTPRGVEWYPRWDRELETYQEANYLACTAAWKDRFPAIPWWND